MGFAAKLVVLLPRTVRVDKAGSRGETDCIIWEDSSFSIDFGHITRLEKVVSHRFSHISFNPYDKAGIIVVDCLQRGAFEDKWKERVSKLVLPEVLEVLRYEHAPDEEGYVTIYSQQLIGGKDYSQPDLEKHLDRSYLCKYETAAQRHNELLSLPAHDLAEKLDKALPWDPPFWWVPCNSIALWLEKAEESGSEGWKALEKDLVALAIVRGWHLQLRELGKLGAQALYLSP